MSKGFDEHTNASDETESFYSRWSKRKLQKRNIQPEKNSTELSTNTSQLERDVESSALTSSTQEKNLLSDKDMPDINTLDEESDYSGFLSPGVSEKLRKTALRKLFQGKSFNICDGLDDYDEEFTTFEKLGDIVTADMRFQLEEEAKRKLQLASESEETSKLTDSVSISEEDGSEHVMNKSISASTVDNDISERDDNKLHDNNLHDNENLS